MSTAPPVNATHQRGRLTNDSAGAAGRIHNSFAAHEAASARRYAIGVFFLVLMAGVPLWCAIVIRMCS